jgi:hypothetical protein
MTLSSIKLANNPIFYACTKHVKIQHHFVKEKHVSKETNKEHVSLKHQVVDLLIKPLGGMRFSNLRNKIGICNVSGLQ